MFTSYTSGAVVKGGVYWNRSRGEFAWVAAEGGRLAGEADDRYLSVPLPMVLLLGPVLGLAFVVLLPLSGLLVLVPFVAARMRAFAFSGRVAAAQMAAPHAQPGISYLENHRRAEVRSEGRDGEGRGELIDLAREIARHRWQEK